MEPIFKSKTFSELTAKELYEIVRARQEVFLMEQRIICRDFDGVDYDSLHCFLEEDDRVVSYLRAYVDEKNGEIHIGRVLTVRRGVGFGRRLMELSFPEIFSVFGKKKITIHSQKNAVGFYEKLGFYVTSEEFLEEGIPHVTMELE